ncbi:MAG: NAD(+) synthase [Erysipelothrix sp.]|nr:NAD(+) synthase [Erysipelothrix sp.]
MKITVGQFNVKSKAVKHNFLQMQKQIILAKDQGYDLIVFGEYAMTGYACGDLFKNFDFIKEVEDYQNQIKDLAKGIKVIFGGLVLQKNHLYNAAILYSEDKVHYSFKSNLNKREFSEQDYFISGDNKVVSVKQKNLLLTFSSDLKTLSDQDYDLLVVLDSSAANNLSKVDVVQDVVYANTVGVSGVCKVVWINGGNSYLKQNNQYYTFKDPLAVGIIEDKGQIQSISKLQALAYGIKIWSDQTFGENKKWIVGSSGGLDSAVTTALLAIALGSENVITYNLASKYNKEITINNAKSIASKLKVRHLEGSIQSLVDQAFTTLNNFGYSEISEFNQENIQARTRGHLLSAFSALEDGVISNNGNKLEITLGYATLYGDTIGALSLIGDLNKVEVFELAFEINNYFDQEIIPKNLLPQIKDYNIVWEIAPSAELKADQLDPMKWFYHDLLLDMLLLKSYEEILAIYLENQFADLEIGKWLKFYDLEIGENFMSDFNWFTKTMQINHFKRLQMPPVLAFGNHVLGQDYKESPNLLPKSKQFLHLEAEIIKKY